MADTLTICELGLRDYAPTLVMQQRLAERRRVGDIGDILLLLEHTPVYTLGASANETDVVLPADECRARGITVVRTTRGGQVTYHGPGQLVGYPILDLTGRGGAVWYVGQLERALIACLAEFGIPAQTDDRRRGVWIGTGKVAALGVRISRGITTHGFALNVAPDLQAFNGIIPCGIRDRGVTAMTCLRPGLTVAQVTPALVTAFASVFEFTAIRRIEAAELEAA